MIGSLYKNADYVEERHRHRYEVNPSVVPELEEKGMKFVGHDIEGERMEIMEIEGLFSALQREGSWPPSFFRVMNS